MDQAGREGQAGGVLLFTGSCSQCQLWLPGIRPGPHLGNGSKDDTAISRHRAYQDNTLCKGHPHPTEAGWKCGEGTIIRMGSSSLRNCLLGRFRG